MPGRNRAAEAKAEAIQAADAMARMERLYGMTMQERGVSRLLSVDLVRVAGILDPARAAAE